MKNLKLLTWLAVVLLPVSAAQAADAYDEGGSDEERFSLRFTGGLLLDSHSTTSSDPSKFNASLPSSTGWNAGGELRFRKRESNTSWRLRYRHYDTAYSNLSGVSPSSVSDRREEFALTFFSAPFSESKFFQHMKLGLGAMVFLRSVDETKPNAVLTSSLTHAITLNMSYGRKITETLSWELNLAAALPFSHREFTTHTGSFVGAFIGRSNLGLSYSISRFVDIAVVPEIRWDRFTFEETGARGTQGAIDGVLSISVPLELRVRF